MYCQKCTLMYFMLCFHKYILSKLSRMPISAGLKLMPTISFQIQHGSFIQLLLITLHTRSLTQRRSRHTAKWMWSSSAFAYFRFNSHRTRLEDPIRGDIELGGTGHRGGLITPPTPRLRSTAGSQSNPVQTKQMVSNIFSLFLGEIISFWPHLLIFFFF